VCSIKRKSTTLGKESFQVGFGTEFEQPSICSEKHIPEPQFRPHLLDQKLEKNKLELKEEEMASKPQQHKVTPNRLEMPNRSLVKLQSHDNLSNKGYKR